jgi:hypothetical protein
MRFNGSSESQQQQQHITLLEMRFNGSSESQLCSLEHTPLPGRNNPSSQPTCHPTLAALFGGMGLLI